MKEQPMKSYTRFPIFIASDESNCVIRKERNGTKEMIKLPFTVGKIFKSTIKMPLNLKAIKSKSKIIRWS